MYYNITIFFLTIYNFRFLLFYTNIGTEHRNIKQKSKNDHLIFCVCPLANFEKERIFQHICFHAKEKTAEIVKHSL